MKSFDIYMLDHDANQSELVNRILNKEPLASQDGVFGWVCSDTSTGAVRELVTVLGLVGEFAEDYAKMEAVGVDTIEEWEELQKVGAAPERQWPPFEACAGPAG